MKAFGRCFWPASPSCGECGELLPNSAHSAISAAACRFKPATKEGHPVAVQTTVEVTFRLTDPRFPLLIFPLTRLEKTSLHPLLCPPGGRPGLVVFPSALPAAIWPCLPRVCLCHQREKQHGQRH